MHLMTMTEPTTQRRLMALLTGAIYAIANSLFPVIDTVMQQTARPWVQRANYANRFSRILQQLLALTARIRPETLTRNPTFPTTPERPVPKPAAAQPPAVQPRQPASVRPLGPLRPARMLSALQVARQLAKLLRQLEQLAAEVSTALPETIRRNITRARALAGCNALPPMPQKSWERAG